MSSIGMQTHRAVFPTVAIVSFLLVQGVAGGRAQPDRKTATLAKVGHALSDLYEDYVRHVALDDGADFESGDPLIRVVEGRVVIDAIASGDAGALRADLEALGMLKVASFRRVVSGQLPIGAIADANALDSLQFARPSGADVQRLRSHERELLPPTADK